MQYFFPPCLGTFVHKTSNQSSLTTFPLCTQKMIPCVMVTKQNFQKRTVKLHKILPYQDQSVINGFPTSILCHNLAAANTPKKYNSLIMPLVLCSFVSLLHQHWSCAIFITESLIISFWKAISAYGIPINHKQFAGRDFAPNYSLLPLSWHPTIVG